MLLRESPALERGEGMSGARDQAAEGGVAPGVCDSTGWRQHIIDCAGCARVLRKR